MLLTALCLLTGCGGRNGEIVVLSREDGSGTRSAFVQLTGVEITDPQGCKQDRTIDTAEITNSTGVMLSSVADDACAIGYVSLGALNSRVKPLAVDGAAATPENVRNGSYPISREFFVVLPQEPSATAWGFVEFILGGQGKAVVEEAGYISCGTEEQGREQHAEGAVTVSGSSSVFPVMEKLAEAYMALQPNVEIVLQVSDSTTGIRDAAGGLCDIGMVSRRLTEEELRNVTVVTVALDGIAVIVHPDNPVEEVTCQQLCGIYTGAVTVWTELLQTDVSEWGGHW